MKFKGIFQYYFYKRFKSHQSYERGILNANKNNFRDQIILDFLKNYSKVLVEILTGRRISANKTILFPDGF